MKLRELLEGVEVRGLPDGGDREISGVAYHSGRVSEGFLFAAIQGLKADGRRFVDEAVERGAKAVVIEESPVGGEAWTGPDRPDLVRVADSRKALARISSNFYGNPSSRVRLIGITGTNGKTTTTYLLEAILTRAGGRVGVIGTINYRYGGRTFPAPNTTPESLDLQKMLREMADAGVTHVLMEVSSHGLDLDRVWGCQFDGAVFTNLTSEHLDYHRTMGHYFESKRKLFSEALTASGKTVRFAVTNQDDPRGEAIVAGLALPVFRYGTNPSCEISAEDVRSTFEGLSCRLRTPEGPLPLRSHLIGGFNLYNLMASAAVAVAMKVPPEAIREGVETLRGVPGRFETVKNGKGIHVIVDYAHTPDALERALTSLAGVMNAEEEAAGAKTDSGRKIITVFGCGGDRDRTKRPLMGEVVGRLSDLALVTSDNPRTEDPAAILDEIEPGLRAGGLESVIPDPEGLWRRKKGYVREVDRRQAIRVALGAARPGDAVLIAGKGHEDYQILGTRKFPFDDRIEARKVLGEV
jgi:UDP-N-acetylmuramoyl-L-alanyl-D-glutamate--2,6-diaminopimelate ligase